MTIVLWIWLSIVTLMVFRIPRAVRKEAARIRRHTSMVISFGQRDNSHE
jgi:hypothetical protein